jgi:hypothetical protein
MVAIFNICRIMDKLMETNSYQKRHTWYNIILGLGLVLILIVVVMVVTVIVTVIVDSSPLDPLPQYPLATLITPINTTLLEQELSSSSGNFIFHVRNDLPHYQVYTTTASATDIANFYEDAAEKAHLTQIFGRDPLTWLVFARNPNSSMIPQRTVGVKIFDKSTPFETAMIRQLIKQSSSDTKIIVLVQGFAEADLSD